ncbi:MAG: hypothetical protein U1C57_00785 [Candidatus Doudnabacteria bacterium]|nr:hypothetical protein [bacterium]MDZ4243621.1 hypothetical protein [Candidatus Doudnabacteria bacterium]
MNQTTVPETEHRGKKYGKINAVILANLNRQGASCCSISLKLGSSNRVRVLGATQNGAGELVLVGNPANERLCNVFLTNLEGLSPTEIHLIKQVAMDHHALSLVH